MHSPQTELYPGILTHEYVCLNHVTTINLVLKFLDLCKTTPLFTLKMLPLILKHHQRHLQQRLG